MFSEAQPKSDTGSARKPTRGRKRKKTERWLRNEQASPQDYEASEAAHPPLRRTGGMSPADWGIALTMYFQLQVRGALIVNYEPIKCSGGSAWGQRPGGGLMATPPSPLSRRTGDKSRALLPLSRPLSPVWAPSELPMSYEGEGVSAARVKLLILPRQGCRPAFRTLATASPHADLLVQF